MAQLEMDEDTPEFIKHCVADVAPKFGNDTSRAFAICTATMQKAGYLKKGTQDVTGKGAAAAARHRSKKGAAGKRGDYEKLLAKNRKESVDLGLMGFHNWNLDGTNCCQDLVALILREYEADRRVNAARKDPELLEFRKLAGLDPSLPGKR